MAKDLQSKLVNQMAYGSVPRSEIPLDFDGYTVSLVKQYYKNTPPELKLKFTSNSKQQKKPDFYIKIDDVREPANPMMLIKYSQSEGKINAKPLSKIKKKLILSVQKQTKQHQDLVYETQKEEDSDIPKRPLFQSLFGNEGSETEGRPRKRIKPNEQEKDQEEQS